MIVLKMTHLKYENDVRALVMAFYHGVKIVVNPSEDKVFDEPVALEMGIDFVDSHLYVCIKDDATHNTIKNAASGADTEDNAENNDDAKSIAEVDKETGATENKVIGKDNIVEKSKVIVQDDIATDFNDYKQTKNDLKRLVYKVLCDYTGRTLPWGTLTGIRPTKIAMSLMDEGYDEAGMRAYFDREYKISEDKYKLCTLVAKNEREILKDIDYKKGYSLYVGIPFCPTICAYCSFSSYPLSAWKNRVDDYLDALFHEIDEVAARIKAAGASIRPLTFYMGGGTPTSLNAGQMDRLLRKLFDTFELEQVAEKTIEAGRPDSITRDKLEVIHSYGISRISINPQTMNQKTLDAIGRRHTVEQVKEAFALARECGFDNINMDLIAGLPGESKEDFAYTLSEIEQMIPESLTVHALAIKRAARVNQEKLYLQSASVEEVNDMINMAFACATRMGQEPYYLYRQKNIAGNLENVGYAKPGLAALYNILIMEEKQSIVALGAGASTKLVIRDENRIERIENVKSVKDYIERNDEMIARKKEADFKVLL